MTVIRTLIQRRPLLWFIVLTFVPAWTYELVCILLLRLPFLPWMFAAPFIGPAAAAFVVTAAVDGRRGVRDLLSKLTRWRVGAGWYLLVVLGSPALLMLCVLPVPGAVTAFRPSLAALPEYVLLYLVVLILGGPLGEEPGWRCFATPRLQQRFGPAGGTLILGLLWAAWHLPLSLIEGYNHAGADLRGILVPFLVFTGFVVAVSFPFTWIANRTQDSGPIAVLLHTSFNASLLPVLFPDVPDSLHYELIQVIALSLLATVTLACTRGRLGYDK
ncbi:type II CAAX endopeptidase family protein [Dactylosporangium fulvum]|uniref:CPBP family intramembrane metalloprotease n=1 Tax=Dactylosporangium fulvum TaxID=53359 RepID=A0ABY5WC24_9ACTN|nr:CPBP family intramembrane glutamic endopeptidase [Dactylosporangium fulvum]UWP85646.1 CPBP family intramembrane metalloprotease [Dactylosporangium fulvum]